VHQEEGGASGGQQEADQQPDRRQAMPDSPNRAPTRGPQCEAAPLPGMRAAGILPSWIEPDAMAALFIAVANGLVLQVTTDPAGPEPDALAARSGGLLQAAGGGV